MIEIDADEIPERIMIVTTEQDGRLADVEVGVPSDAAFVSFNVVEKPTAKAEPVSHEFVPSRSSVNEFLVHDEGAKGMFCRAYREARMDSVSV